MKTWQCNDLDCGVEFQAERSRSCPKCGSTDISLLERVTQEPSEPRRETEPGELEAILRELCMVVYESPYQGREWFEAIDRTMKRLQPFLRETESVHK